MNTGDKLGRYELGEPIGEGAMSEVFASRHPLLERDVAIKVLKKEVCSDQQYVARFLDDARAAHLLNHPNIVRVLDVDDSEAQPFIVMDLVDGQPLDEWRKGQVELPVAVKIARDVASALAAAHAAGMIHRDVKPSNVLLERKTKLAKLTDFGAAKREREGGAQLTQMGQRIGTPRYMAPEQVEGGQVSKCTDLFALGALLYELIAGRPAFEGESVSAVYHGILFKDPTPLREVRPDVPAPLSELVERLLAKKPEDRPASGEDVVAALDGLDQAAPSGVAKGVPGVTDATVTGQTGTGTTSTSTGATGPGSAGAPPPADTSGEAPPPPPYRGASKTFGGIMERSRLVPVAAGVVLLLVVVAGGFWAFSGGDAPSEPELADAGEMGEEPGLVEEPAGEEVRPEATAEVDEEPAEPAPEEEVAEPDDAAAEQAEAPDQQAGTGGEATGLASEAPADAAAEGEPVETAAGGQAGEASGSGAPTFAQSLREEEQPAEGQDPAALPDDEQAGGEQPEGAGGDAAATAETPAEPTPEQSDQAQQTAEPAPDQQEEGAESEAQVAAVRPDEPPALPEGEQGGEITALDCAADEPGCAFAETVLAAVEPDAAAGPDIFLNDEDGVYLDQEYLVVEVAMPEDLGGYLYLDVYTDNGEVFHLLPEPLREDNALRAGAMIRVGVEEDERASGIRHWQISGPFGTGYLVALVTENRLFDDLRPIGESIESYRPVLLDALDDPATGRTAFSVTPVEFRPR